MLTILQTKFILLGQYLSYVGDMMKKEHLVIGLSLVLLFLIFGFESGCWGHGTGVMGGLSVGLSLFLWALLLIFIYYLLVSREKRREDAFDMLKERYAKGEITRDEYIEIWTDLITRND